jgi:hypothetical protein
LIDRRGRDMRILDWLDELTADCPRKQKRQHQRPVPRTVPGFAEGVVKKWPKPLLE